MATTHLVIPDPHARPGVSNNRFTWAGRLAVDRMPDTIICLGDLFDFPSLCSYDKGKRSFEGRRVKLDLEAGHDALAKFNAPIDEYNARCRANKKSQYKPRKVMLLGNHEQRLERCLQMHSELEGTLSYKNLRLEEFGWSMVPFLKPIEVDGIWYVHYCVSGMKGESVSGLNIASSIIAKSYSSMVVGHNHGYDWAVKATPDGRKIMGLCGGCYLDEKQVEDYAFATDFLWWRGLTILNNVSAGEYDLETFTIKRVKELYGKETIDA